MKFQKINRQFYKEQCGIKECSNPENPKILKILILTIPLTYYRTKF